MSAFQEPHHAGRVKIGISQCVELVALPRLPPWVLAVLRLVELRVNKFLAPDLVPRATRVNEKVLISLHEVTIDRRNGIRHRIVVAVMNDGLRHATENRFNDIQELSGGWKWCEFHHRGSVLAAVLRSVDFIYFSIKPL